MLERLRSGWTKLIRPLALGLLRLGITPDMVTWTGTIATVVIATVCFPQGWLWQGVLLLLLVIFSDTLDGTMAREAGTSSNWGAFLDSTLDRIADGAIFGSLALYFVIQEQSAGWAAVTVGALIFAQVTSYSKARGEAVGVAVKAGLVGRPDRLVIGLVGAFLAGLGLTWALPVSMLLVLVGGVFTVGQRMMIVRRATRQPGQTEPDEI